MSADNFYCVKYDMKRGGYIVRMGFASDDLPVFARGDEELFAKGEEALSEARRRAGEDYTEYGVSSEQNDAYFTICYPDEFRAYATEQVERFQRLLGYLDEWEECDED